LDLIPKKSWLEISSEPASLEFVSYANLIAIVVMIPMMAINPMPVVPVVSVSPGIAIVPIWSVVSVSVTWVSVTWIAIIAVAVGWITKSNSYAPDSD
jgi:hypothetical protein